MECSCGCGRLIKRPRYLIAQGKTYARAACHVRGKTYLEIYGLKRPKCGFQKGEANIGRLNGKYTARVVNKFGEKFHSKLEASFSNLLHANKIAHEKQVPIKLVDGKYKVVDFVIKDPFKDILVEISGFAYSAWRKDFRRKIAKLRRSVDNQIVILTYQKNLNRVNPWTNIHSVISEKDILVGSVEDENRILRTIKFCQGINQVNQMLTEVESCQPQ